MIWNSTILYSLIGKSLGVEIWNTVPGCPETFGYAGKGQKGPESVWKKGRSSKEKGKIPVQRSVLAAQKIKDLVQTQDL